VPLILIGLQHQERFGALFFHLPLPDLFVISLHTMMLHSRFRAAAKAASLHLVCSLVVAVIAAVLVFGLWYPYPYRDLSGGRELFLLVVAVDVVCGPLLTLVLFNPAKPRKELVRDLGLVGLIQMVALVYGVWTVWQVRPLYLALEVDRFKVVMAPDLDPVALDKLPANLRPLLWGGPRTVALRPPIDVQEKNKVLFAAINGGRDYAERPEFYLPYEGAAALKSLTLAKSIGPFLDKYPDQKAAALGIAQSHNAALNDWKLLPVAGRQDWVALLDKQGQIKGFLKGDGF
jgi:hypothetical protein